MPEITLDSEDQFNLNPPSSFEDPPDVLPLFVTSKNPGYKKWTLTRDPSIDEDRDNHIYGFEFASPIIYVGLSDDWFRPVNQIITGIFEFFKNFEIEVSTNDSCSTHVHVSPQKWSPARVEQLTFASFYFEEAIRSMFPFQRQTSTYAKEFRHPKIIGRFLLEHTGRPIDNLPWVNTKQVATDDLIACLRTLKGKNLSIRELVEFINPRDHEKVHQTYRRLTHTQTIAHFDRYFAWNFNNLIFDKDGKRTDTALGSVEFRRPAGSVKPSDALTWVEFIVGFTLAAFDHGDIETLKTYPRERVFPKEHSKDEVYYASSLASLKAFIQAPKKVPRPGTDIVFADQPGFKNPTGYLDRILSGPVAIPRAPTKEELEFMKLWEDWAGQRNHEDNFVSAIEFLCVDDVSLPTRPENAIL